jgi:methyltransferase (TIGR00027 family)
MVPGFCDPYAELLLNQWFSVWFKLGRRWLERCNDEARERVLDQLDVLPVRTATIDRAVADALNAGITQVVILGAGFDTRAYRLENIEKATVFEVDHRLTQEDKKRRAQLLPAPRARLVWVEVDFENDDLAQRLRAEGHDSSLATLWLWEGVVMYLLDDAVISTLRCVQALSANGSRLVVQYHIPSAGRPARMLRSVITGWLGEPQVGTREPAHMQRLVHEAGFVLDWDLSCAEQAVRLGARAPSGDPARVSRILLAQRA